MFKLINLFIGYGVISKRNYIKSQAKKGKRDLMFLSQLTVEICTLVACILIGVFRGIKWCFKKVSKSNSNIEKPNNVTNFNDYKKKCKIS